MAGTVALSATSVTSRYHEPLWVGRDLTVASLLEWLIISQTIGGIIMDTYRGYTAQQWAEAFYDTQDGSTNARELQQATGLPLERCAELWLMFINYCKED